MAKLTRNASGQKHLRWLREIIATIKAHQQHDYLLTDAQRKALGAELKLLEPLAATLDKAVAPYREFVENAHVEVRARQRVGDYLCDEGQREADGRLRPRKRDIDALLAGRGGFSAIFSKTSLSRVLGAGRAATVGFAETGAGLLRALPASTGPVGELADALDRAAEMLRKFNLESDALEARRLPLRMAVQKAVIEVREALDQMDGRLRTHFSQDFIASLYPELTRKGTAVADEPDEEDDDTGPPAGPTNG